MTQTSLVLVLTVSTLLVACGDKGNEAGAAKSSNESTTATSANSKVTNFIGTWGGSGKGALGTCGKDPVVITQNEVAVGKDRFPITFDATGDIPLAGGATALRSQDKETLIYLNSDGLELDMKRCK